MSDSETIPTANVTPRRPGWWMWLIPLAAGLFVLGLVFTYVIQRGPVVTVTMSYGHGIKPGDALRCRGIPVGQVEAVRLGDELTGVEVTVRLQPDAADLARAGSRFWVERPRVSLSGVAGLETLAGPRYMAVLPGAGAYQRQFVALPQPPVVESVEPDGLEVVLLSDRRHSLKAGAPILYRGAPIGVVLGVGLSSDAASIEARAYIEPAYTALVRDNSKFWNVSGAKLDAGLTGFSLELESIQSLVTGGVAMATPTQPGQRVTTGHRFELARQADEDWLSWRPALAVGSALLPSGASRPDMLRATRRNGSAGFFSGERRLSGWLLPVAGGVIGPADLLASGSDAAQLEVAGQRFELNGEPSVSQHGLAERTLELSDVSTWPSDRVRRMSKPEDCVMITDPSLRVVPLAATRLRADGASWRVDRIVSFDAAMHGAAVLSRKDGALVGLLLIDDGQGVVVPLPGANDADASDAAGKPAG